MRIRRGAVGALAVIAGGYSWRSSVAPVERPPASSFAVDAVKAGAALAAIGNGGSSPRFSP